MKGRLGTINTPEGKILCEAIGLERSKIPMLLVNGGPCGSRINLMDTIGGMLADRPVISYSQMNSPGSVPNSRTDSSYWTLEYYTEEIERVRYALDIEKMIIFGHSWGGGLALNYAAQHPDRCAGIVAGSPLVRAADWARDTAKRLEEIRPEVNEFVEGIRKSMPEIQGDMLKDVSAKAEEALFIARYQDAYLTPTLYLRYLLGQRKENSLPEGKEVYQYMWGQNEYDITGTLKDMNITGILREINVPVLFVCGEYDEILPDTVIGYSKMVPQGSFHVVKEGTHTFFNCMTKEEYAKFSERIHSWTENIDEHISPSALLSGQGSR